MVTVFPKVISSPYPRTRLPLFLYSVSIALAIFLIYWGAVYCNYNTCVRDYGKKSKHLFQFFPIVAAPIIMLISLTWLVTAFFYSNNSCTYAYNFMEMPSAVLCSLLGGVSAVIEIHFSIDEVHSDGSDQWLWSAAVSISLCFLHAIVAFTLQ